jgi:GT2 family glycosyltransferase
MPRCSIIIPVHNKASLTRQCLDTLFAAAPAGAWAEIIVVDDASIDGTAQLLTRYGERIRVVAQATNAGFAAASNAGAALAAGEYLVFLNNDTIPQPGWLEALVRYADNHPRAAVVGSKLLFPDDTIQHAGMAICQDRLPRHIYRGFPADHPAVNKSRRFQAVTAASMLVSRTLFEQVGGFDSAFLNGYEDVDLCLRLAEGGHEVHYCHESTLYHLEAVTREVRNDHQKRNWQLYRSRWVQRVQPDDLQYYLEDGLLMVDHCGLYPINVSVSPLLAVVCEDGQRRRTDRLLEVRTQQVLNLWKDNIRLQVRVQEAEFRAEGNCRHGASPVAGSQAPNGEPAINPRPSSESKMLPSAAADVRHG